MISLDSLLGEDDSADPLRRRAKQMERHATETEDFWSGCLEQLLSARERTRADLAADKKSAAWKLELANEMKR